jgi:hypothetical protein
MKKVLAVALLIVSFASVAFADGSGLPPVKGGIVTLTDGSGLPPVKAHLGSDSL